MEIHTEGYAHGGDMYIHEGTYERRDIHTKGYIHGGTCTRRGHIHGRIYTQRAHTHEGIYTLKIIQMEVICA